MLEGRQTPTHSARTENPEVNVPVRVLEGRGAGGRPRKPRVTCPVCPPRTLLACSLEP